MSEEGLSKKEKRQLAKEKKQKEKTKNEIVSRAKKYGIWLVVLAALGFGGYKFYQWITTPTAPSLSPAFQTDLEVSQSDWVKGSSEAKVTLVEYSDFQCPACASYAPLVSMLNTDFPEDLRIIYRHFPLASVHPNSIPAARAAEAAGRQDKFWEMHDILFERQNDWADALAPKDKFFSYAEELELDKEKFEQDYDDKEIVDKINQAYDKANDLGLSSTPTFFMNGVLVQAPNNYESFRGLIGAQLDLLSPENSDQ